MSAVVKVGSKLPGDAETNGLDAQAAALILDPKQIRCAVVWYDTHHVTINTDEGSQIPTIRFRRFEPIGDASDVPQSVQDAVAVAMEERTGRTPLPFGVVTVDELPLED